MKNDDELWNLVERLLMSPCEDLWDELEPEERRRVFPKLIAEFVEANF